jgi:hypothetical protein
VAIEDLEKEPGAEVRMLVQHTPRRPSRSRSARLGAFSARVTHLEDLNLSDLRARADMRRAGIVPVKKALKESKQPETPLFAKFMGLAKRVDEHAFLQCGEPITGELVSLPVDLPPQAGKPAEKLYVGIRKNPQNMNERRHMLDKPSDLHATDSIFVQRRTAGSNTIQTTRVYLYDLRSDHADLREEAEQALLDVEKQIDRFEAVYLPPAQFPRLTHFSPVIDPYIPTVGIREPLKEPGS